MQRRAVHLRKQILGTNTITVRLHRRDRTERNYTASSVRFGSVATV